jgi:hypothetical protein
MTGSFIGRLLYKLVNDAIGKLIRGQENTPTAALMRAMAQEMPMRSMLMAPGPLDRPKLEALLLMINGHFIKGLFSLIRSGLSRN